MSVGTAASVDGAATATSSTGRRPIRSPTTRRTATATLRNIPIIIIIPNNKPIIIINNINRAMVIISIIINNHRGITIRSPTLITTIITTIARINVSRTHAPTTVTTITIITITAAVAAPPRA